MKKKNYLKMLSYNKVDNIRRCLMSLLYLQTKEIELLYNKKTISEKNYFLVDKEWLNKYKQSLFK